MLAQILDLTPREAKLIIPLLFTYRFGKISLKDYVKKVGDRDLAHRTKEIARTHGYILKNCKLYMYNYRVALKYELPLPKAKDYGITLKDAKVLREIDISFVPYKYRAYALSLKRFDEKLMLISMYDSHMKAHIGKLISAKMKFLIDSYGQQRDALESMLVDAGITAVYKKYPRFQSDLHMINIAKSAIHNTAMTFIKFHTAECRQALRRNADGTFEAVNVDLSIISDIEAPADYGADFKEALQDLVKLRGKLSPLAQSVLMVLAGHHHEGFSEFLGCDNSDVADRWSYEKYSEKVQNYFELPPDGLNKLYAFLRNRI